MFPARRIAVVSHFGWGIYRYRLDLLRHLRREGWDVVAIADWSDGNYEEIVRSHGIRTESMNLTRAPLDPFADLRTCIQLFRLYRRLKLEVVQHFTLRVYLLGGLAARLAGVSKIVNCVNGLGIVLGGSLSRWSKLFLPLYKVAFGGRVVAVFQNTTDQERMIRSGIVPRDRTVHIPGSGIDTDALRPDPNIAPEDRNIVIMASRMVWSKGVKEFAGAAEKLKPRYSNIRFLLAGGLSQDYGMKAPDGCDVAWLEAQTAQGSMEWLKHIAPEKLEALFQRAAAVVLPSSYPEGIPRCLIEGASAGAPIITTDTPGCRDAVIDGISGYVCDEHSVDSLADAIDRLLSEPGAVARMSEQSRGLALRLFASPSICNAFVRIYDTTDH